MNHQQEANSDDFLLSCLYVVLNNQCVIDQMGHQWTSMSEVKVHCVRVSDFLFFDILSRFGYNHKHVDACYTCLFILKPL